MTVNASRCLNATSSSRMRIFERDADRAFRYLDGMELTAEAVLFDIDGTLVDSTPVVERTWRSWARNHDVNAEEVLRVCHGRRTEDTVAMFVPEEDLASATDELEQLELHDFDGVTALPAAARLLASLPPDRWAAVTSGSQQLMRARLAVAGLPVPAVLIAADDVTEGKPSPQGYRLAAQTLGVDIRRCIVVEDAPAGIGAGLASDAIATIAVSTSHDPAQLRAATVVIRDLSALEITTVDGALRVVAHAL